MSKLNLVPEDDEFVFNIERLLESRANEIDVVDPRPMVQAPFGPAQLNTQSEPRTQQTLRRSSSAEPTPLHSRPKPRQNRYHYLAACAAVVIVIVGLAATTPLFGGSPSDDNAPEIETVVDVADAPERRSPDEQERDPTIQETEPTGEVPEESQDAELEDGDRDSEVRPPEVEPPTSEVPVPENQPPPTPEGLPVDEVVGVPEDELRTVRGIVVHVDIAANVEALLADAEADGLIIRGSGYRDPADQVRLREINCGPTNYDIYERPPSQCSPPTAVPGSTMHEKARAIDFQDEDGAIVTQGSPIYVWLQANAARYELQNLPAEPWHWSTNGL